MVSLISKEQTWLISAEFGDAGNTGRPAGYPIDLTNDAAIDFPVVTPINGDCYLFFGDITRSTEVALGSEASRVIMSGEYGGGDGSHLGIPAIIVNSADSELVFKIRIPFFIDFKKMAFIRENANGTDTTFVAKFGDNFNDDGLLHLKDCLFESRTPTICGPIIFAGGSCYLDINNVISRGVVAGTLTQGNYIGSHGGIIKNSAFELTGFPDTDFALCYCFNSNADTAIGAKTLVQNTSFYLYSTSVRSNDCRVLHNASNGYTYDGCRFRALLTNDTGTCYLVEVDGADNGEDFAIFKNCMFDRVSSVDGTLKHLKVGATAKVILIDCEIDTSLIEIVPGGEVVYYTTETNANGSVTVDDKTGYALSSSGLDSISATEPSGRATTFREMIIQTWMRFFNRVEKNVDTITVYNKDDDTAVTTQGHETVGDTTTVWISEDAP